MSGTQGDLYRRLLELEREVIRLRGSIDVQPARQADAADHRAWRLAVTAKDPNTDTYPSEGSNPNTYWVKFVDADWSPKDDGSTSLSTYVRSEAPRVPARNMASGSGSFIPEGRLVLVVWNKGRNADAGHWHLFHREGGGGEPIRFRLTTSMSVFGTASGMRQKWDGAAYIDDGDYPDTVTLVDYAGVASSGDANDKCFAVEMPDRTGVYEVVEIQQAGSAPFVLFKIDDTGGLTHAMATVDALVVTSYGAGLDPDDPITVRNFETHTAGVYRFAAPDTYRGLAFYNGTDWSIVELEEPVKFAQIEFICNETVATTDASFDAEITRLIGDAALVGVEVEDVVTVYNRADITDYVFTGSNLTSVGLAQWDSVLGRWDAIWITCPAE